MWNVILWIHLIAMAFFVGGQLFLGAAVVPALKGDESGAMKQIAKNFGIGTVVAIGISIASGFALAVHENAWQEPAMHAKLTLLVAVIVLIGAHMKFPKSRLLDGLILLCSLGLVAAGVVLAEQLG